MTITQVEKMIHFSFILWSFCCVFTTIHAQGSSNTAFGNLSIATSFSSPATPSSSLVQSVSNSSSIPPHTASINASTTTSAIPTKTPTTEPPSTQPSPTPTPHSKEDKGRKFDGLSFFGGMILGAAVCIILLFAVKYYRAKKRSYHSL